MRRLVQFSVLFIVVCLLASPFTHGQDGDTVLVKSANAGKIVGKWEATDMPGIPANIKVYMEFAKNNEFKLSIADLKAISGKYRLEEGTKVTLYDLSEELSGSKKHTENIEIKAGVLTMKDSDGTTAKFKKVGSPDIKAKPKDKGKLKDGAPLKDGK